MVSICIFSALLDTVILNSIQFWNRDNPIKASDLDDDGQTKVAQVGNLTMRWTSTSEGAIVTYGRHGAIERRAVIVSSATGYRLLDERGMTLAETEYAPNGTVTVLDYDCRFVQQWTDDQLGLLVRSHGTIQGESVALLSPR